MKKRSLAIISAIAGVCMLTTAAFANYQTANGYDAFKKAVFNLPKYDNYTLKMNMEFSGDGKEFSNYTVSQEYSKAAEAMHELGVNVDDGQYVSEYWVQDGKRIYHDNGENGGYYGYSEGVFDRGGLEAIRFNNDDKTNAKVMRFAELFADTVVGDLKNNFVCVEDGENSSTYEVNLSSIQIPELINAGLGALFSITNFNYEHDEYYQNEENLSESDKMMMNLGDNATVDSVKCRFTVNKDNMLSSGEGTIVFVGQDKNGEKHDITVHGTLDITEVGSTVVPKLDTSNIKIDWFDYGEEDTEVNAEVAEN